MSNKDELEAELKFLESRTDPRWDEARERVTEELKQAKESDAEVEELSAEEPSMTEEIEELERDYTRYNRVAEGAASSQNERVYRKMANTTLKELVNLKNQELEELAREHDNIEWGDSIGAATKKRRLKSEFDGLRIEIEEMQKKVE